MDDDAISFADNLSSEYGDDTNIIYDIEVTGIKINWAIIKTCRKNPTQIDIRLLISILRETLELYTMYQDHDAYCMKIINMLLRVRSHIFLKSIVTVIRLEYYSEYDKLMQHILLNKMNAYHNANHIKKNTIYIDIEYLFSIVNKNVISGSIVEFIKDNNIKYDNIKYDNIKYDNIKYIHTLEELLDDYFDDYIDSIISQIVFNGAKDLFIYMHKKYGSFNYMINKLISVYIESIKTIYVSDNILVTMKELGYIINKEIDDCIMWIASNTHILDLRNMSFHLDSLLAISTNKKLPYMIMINIICSNHYGLFQKMIYSHFSHLSNVRKFCFIAQWAFINNNIIERFFENTQYSLEEKDDIFINICRNNNLDVARWLVYMNPYRYYIGVENEKLVWFDIDYDMTLPPIIYDNMKPNYVEKMGECTVCYEEIDSYIVLPCHNTHIVCTSCFIRMIESTNCPMCRSQYHISYCNLNIHGIA